MRIIGFSKKWPKLDKRWFSPDQHTFTTFRYPRKDRDWEVEEVVQVVFKPRSKEREVLGVARIIRKQGKDISKEWMYYPFPSSPNTPDMITSEEAREDGFTGRYGAGDIDAMIKFIKDWSRPPLVNKITLYWIDRNEALL